MKTPKDFRGHPYDSVLQKMEAEIVARNIMVILARTGNVFRELTWGEYKAERTKDGELGGLWKEKLYFGKVLPYCVSPEMAVKFSLHWG